MQASGGCPEHSFLGTDTVSYNPLRLLGCLPLDLRFGGEAGRSLEGHHVLDTKRDSSHCVLCKEYHWKGSTGPSTRPSPVSQSPKSAGSIYRKSLRVVRHWGGTAFLFSWQI